MTILLPIAKPVAAAVAASVRGLPIGWGVASAPPDGENQAPTAGTLDLGALTVGAGAVFASGDLLAGATDPDGDTLTVTSVTAVSGGTATGSGPYTITPTAAGPGSASVVISDGRGGSVSRPVTWAGIPAFTPGVFKLIPTSAAGLDTASPLGTDVADLTISGNTAHGGTITLTSAASAFAGGGLPQKVVYSDYGNGVIGQEPGTAATVGAWDTGGGAEGQTKFVAGGHGGRPALPIYNHEDDPDQNSRPVNRRGLLLAEGFDEAFGACSIKVPTGKAWFGAEADSGWGGTTPAHGIFVGDSALKLNWYGRNEETSPIDLIFFTYASQEFAVNGNNNPDSTDYKVDIPAASVFHWGNWNHYRHWFRRDRTTPANSDFGHEFRSRKGIVRSYAKGEVVKIEAGETLYNSVNYCRWANGNSNCLVLSGYEYNAVGNFAACRLEYGHHPVYARNKVLSPAPPSAWSGGQVMGLVNDSDLDPAKPVFVFVMGRNNQPVYHGKLLPRG